MIVEEIALTGQNPGKLLGAPTPVICSEYRTDDTSAFVCPGCGKLQDFVSRLEAHDCSRCGKVFALPLPDYARHYECPHCGSVTCNRCGRYRPRVTRRVIQKLMNGEKPIKPRVQLLDGGVINDSASILLPHWAIPQQLGEEPFTTFSVIKLKSWHVGPCALGANWLIIDEIEPTGKVPKRLMGSPKPWSGPEGLTPGCLSAIAAGERPTSFTAHIAKVSPEVQLFDGTTLSTVRMSGKATAPLAAGGKIRVTHYGVVGTIITILACQAC
jgi:predicted RNA-binding Zn-ribbon protein involved in translation (DUF1610 family)